MLATQKLGKTEKSDEISKNELGNYSEENNELECQQTINKPNGWFFKKKKKSNKIDRTLIICQGTQKYK